MSHALLVGRERQAADTVELSTTASKDSSTKLGRPITGYELDKYNEGTTNTGRTQEQRPNGGNKNEHRPEQVVGGLQGITIT